CPADRLPAMCGNATLAMLVSSTSMNVASVTVSATSQGLNRGRHTASSSGSDPRDKLSWEATADTRGTLVGEMQNDECRMLNRRRDHHPRLLLILHSSFCILHLLDFHFRRHRHAGGEQLAVGGRFVQVDLDRQALDDLDLVAGGVLGW